VVLRSPERGYNLGMRSLSYPIQVLALSIALSVAPAFANLKLPVPQLETLPNGLTLAWFVSDSLPVVDIALTIKSGSRDDAPGKSGTAELLGELLDRGADGQSAQAMALAVERLGATRAISADEDTFSVGMHGLAPDAARLLELLAKIAIRPDLSDAEFKREHARMIDRWSHIADYGETLVTLGYRKAVTQGTSYNRGGFASTREFKSVSRADVAGFHRIHFTPKNSVLMVVGRVDQPEFRKQVLRLFGTPEAWSGEAPRRDWRGFSDARIPRKKGTVLLIDRPNLTQAEVRIGFVAPDLRSPDRYALAVSNALLGEYFNSRLNLLIRDQLGLTYGIASSFAYNRDFTAFTIGSATRNEAVGQLIRRTMGVLQDLKKGPLPAEEVRTAKEYLIGGFPLGVSTLSAVASRWIAGYIFDLGPEYLNEYVPRVRAVTEAEAHAAVAKHFKLDELVITVAGDAAAIGKSLKEAALPFVKVVPQQLM
jgi:zinc protease